MRIDVLPLQAPAGLAVTGAPAEHFGTRTRNADADRVVCYITRKESREVNRGYSLAQTLGCMSQDVTNRPRCTYTLF